MVSSVQLLEPGYRHILPFLLPFFNRLFLVLEVRELIGLGEHSTALVAWEATNGAEANFAFLSGLQEAGVNAVTLLVKLDEEVVA